MIRLVLVLLVGIAIGVLLLPWLRRVGAAASPPRPVADELVKDPVCQAYIVRSRALARVQDGVLRHFCSQECARQFAHRGSGTRG
jgi:YHS domain-containing protein